MRCKACDAALMEHASKKLVAEGLCPECYIHSKEAIVDYEHGLAESVRPSDIHAATWSERYVKPVYPDSDD